MAVANIVLSEGQHAIVTQICTLRFRDGAMVAAQLSASSPYEDCVVEYSGALDRLPVRPGCASSVLLKALFQSFAREVRGTFEEKIIGSWDRYGDDQNDPEPAFEAEENSQRVPFVDR